MPPGHESAAEQQTPASSVFSFECIDMLRDRIDEPSSLVAAEFHDHGVGLEAERLDIEDVISFIEKHKRNDEDPDGIGVIEIIRTLVSGDETEVSAVHERVARLQTRAQEFLAVAKMVAKSGDTYSVLGHLVVDGELPLSPSNPRLFSALETTSSHDEEDPEDPDSLEAFFADVDRRDTQVDLLPEDRLTILAQQVTGAYDEHVREDTRWTGFRQALIGLGKTVDARGLVYMGQALGLQTLALIHKIETTDPEELDITSAEIQAALILRARLLQDKPEFYNKLRDKGLREGNPETAKTTPQKPNVEVVTMVRRRHGA